MLAYCKIDRQKSFASHQPLPERYTLKTKNKNKFTTKRNFSYTKKPSLKTRSRSPTAYRIKHPAWFTSPGLGQTINFQYTKYRTRHKRSWQAIKTPDDTNPHGTATITHHNQPNINRTKQLPELRH